MSTKRGNYRIRTKIWIEDDNGEVIFGEGRFRILKAVEEQGSLSAAAKSLGMSYRAVWGKIKATEERLGRQLLRKQSGGASGGGSELTPFATDLLRKFTELQNLSRDKADSFFSNTLVPEISRKSAHNKTKP